MVPVDQMILREGLHSIDFTAKPYRVSDEREATLSDEWDIL